MKSKLGIITILLMSFLLLIPPMFSKDGIFNIQYTKLNECGELVLLDGLYFDNSFYLIMYITFAFLGFSIPFMIESLSRDWKRLSTIIGSWFFSGVVSGVLNISIPEIVINNSSDNILFIKFAVFFSVALVVIMSSETIWKQQKN